jgi:hypothetical protein
MRGQDDRRGRRADKVEGSRMGENRGNIRWWEGKDGYGRQQVKATADKKR